MAKFIAWECQSFHVKVTFFLVGNPGLSQGKDIDVLIDDNIPDDVSFVPDRWIFRLPTVSPGPSD